MYIVHGRWACLSSTDLDPEGEELEDALDGEEDGEDGVEPAQRVRVVRRLVVELQAQQHKQPLTHTKQLHMCTQQHAVAANHTTVTHVHTTAHTVIVTHTAVQTNKLPSSRASRAMSYLPSS